MAVKLPTKTNGELISKASAEAEKLTNQFKKEKGHGKKWDPSLSLQSAKEQAIKKAQKEAGLDVTDESAVLAFYP